MSFIYFVIIDISIYIIIIIYYSYFIYFFYIWFSFVFTIVSICFFIIGGMIFSKYSNVVFFMPDDL